MWTLIDYALGIAPGPRDSHKMVTGDTRLASQVSELKIKYYVQILT